MINLGDSRKPRYYEEVVHPFYRKQSPTKTVTLYLPSLNVWCAPDSRYHVERYVNDFSIEDNPFTRGMIEGIVGVNPEIFSRVEKVFVEITARYIYNKSVVDRYNFNINRVAFRVYRCLYPPRSTKDDLTTYSELPSYWKPIQEFIRKNKTNHFPFYFDLNDGPDSLWMHDFNDPQTTQPHNGIIWECFTYVGLIPSPDPNPFDTAKLRFRKLTYIPEDYRLMIPIPMKFQDRQFCTCTCKADNGVITLAARLNKYTYCQNEEIKVYVKVHNTSPRVIQRIRIAAEQLTVYDTYENNEIKTKVDCYLLNDEVKDLPILPYTEDWKVMVKLLPSVRRSEYKEISIEPPDRNSSQSPLDCALSSTSFPFSEMEKIIEKRNQRTERVFKNRYSTEDDVFDEYETREFRRITEIPKNLIEGLITPVAVKYQVTVKAECPKPTLKCVRYEAPELSMEFFLVNCTPSPVNYIPTTCIKMENTECIS